MSDTQFIDYALIPHSNKQLVLLVNDDPHSHAERVFSLPRFETLERHFWQHTEFINQAVRASLNLEVTALCCLSNQYYPAEDGAVPAEINVYAMENHNPDWSPPAEASWFAKEEMAGLSLLPDERMILETWFDWLEQGPGVLRVPWYKAGWYDNATKWAAAQLTRLGYSIFGIDQVRTWERSSVLRIRTLTGNIYFKAVPPMFAHEPALMQWLATGYPKRFPQVISIDPDRGWILMRDYEGETLDRLGSPDNFIEGMGRYARIQANLILEIETLRALGCPDRRLPIIADDMDRLFADAPAMLFGRDSGLDMVQIETLRRYAPHLRQMCTELDDCGIPASLEHGDLFPGQIAYDGENYIFIDWSDCSLSHPFFSLAQMLDFIDDEYREFPPEAKQRLVEAYIEPWKSYAPPERLLQIVELSRPLAVLHCALLYHQRILPWMEIKWEMERMVPHYLKLLLRHLGKA